MALLAMLAGLASTAVPAGAASGSWQGIGPSGGVALGLAVDPDVPTTVYAAAGGGGLFKTVDGGRSWVHSDSGLLAAYPFRVAIDPAATATVYAATLLGLFKSADGAVTWTAAGGGLATPFVVDVVIDPRRTRTLYAANGSRVFKSVDGAASWFDSGAGLPWRGLVEALTIDPRHPATLYAGTTLGVFKSTDRAASWRPARVGMGTPDILSLAADPLAAGTVYAGAKVNDTASAGGLFVSTDGGATWTAKPIPNAAGAGCVAVSPAAPRAAYACSPGHGLLKSTDGGTTWHPINSGLGAAEVGTLAIAPSSPQQIYAGVNLGRSSGSAVYKTASGGVVWRPFGNGIDAASVSALAVDPIHAGTLYIGTADSGVLASNDDGGHWAPANRGLRGANVMELAIDPLAPATLYVETEGGFFATANAAARWSRPGARFDGRPLILDPQTPTTLYSFAAGSRGLEALFKSLDGGASWTEHDSIPAGGVSAAAIAPSAPATVYLAGVTSIEGHQSTALVVSQDGGTTFQRLPTLFFSVHALAVDPATPTTLYVAAEQFDPASSILTPVLYKSTDGGVTLAQLPGIEGVSALLIDPADPSVLYAGALPSSGGAPGVLVSHDGGASWSELASGFPEANVVQLAFGPGGTLYAGTEGASVYRYSLR